MAYLGGLDVAFPLRVKSKAVPARPVHIRLCMSFYGGDPAIDSMSLSTLIQRPLCLHEAPYQAVDLMEAPKKACYAATKLLVRMMPRPRPRFIQQGDLVIVDVECTPVP